MKARIIRGCQSKVFGNRIFIQTPKYLPGGYLLITKEEKISLEWRNLAVHHLKQVIKTKTNNNGTGYRVSKCKVLKKTHHFCQK